MGLPKMVECFCLLFSPRCSLNTFYVSDPGMWIKAHHCQLAGKWPGVQAGPVLLAGVGYWNVPEKGSEARPPTAWAGANHRQPVAVIFKIMNQLSRCLCQAVLHRHRASLGTMRTSVAVQRRDIEKWKCWPCTRTGLEAPHRNRTKKWIRQSCRVQNQHTKISCFPCNDHE